jgi:methyl-accepting chemotaxis protein
MLLVLPLTFKISNSITGPLQKLMTNFENASRGDFSLRMAVTSRTRSASWPGSSTGSWNSSPNTAAAWRSRSG